MRSPYAKVFAIILALLLGFSPLQATVAIVLDSPSKDTGTHQVMVQHGESHAMAHHPTSHDGQQQGNNGCTGHDGTSNHCVSCVVGLVPLLFTLNATPAVSSNLRTSSDGFVSQPATSLYRPPRG
jgi:hypothetical protein